MVGWTEVHSTLSMGLTLGDEGAGGSGPPPYQTGAVAFDGMTSLLNAALASTDNEFICFSYWLNIQNEGSPSDDPMVFNIDPVNLYTASWVLEGPPNLGTTFQVAADFTGTYIQTNTNSDVTPVPDATWTHFCGSAQTNLPAGQKLIQVLMNGADVTGLVNDGADAFNCLSNGRPFYIGTDLAGSTLTGYLADLWVAPGQSLLAAGAISPATLAKFYSGGKPVNLGADGSTPTGTAPAVFCRRAPAAAASTFATNLGTGGSFTTIGALTIAPSSPSG